MTPAVVGLRLQRAADAICVEDLATQVAKLLDLLEDSVVVRPNGDAFQVVRVAGGLRYLPVDVAALVRDGHLRSPRRPAPHPPLLS